MNQMIDRVARAMHGNRYEWAEFNEEQKELWFSMARVGIEAMREPTDEMLDAEIEGAEPLRKACLDDYSAKRVYQLMIDAALK